MHRGGSRGVLGVRTLPPFWWTPKILKEEKKKKKTSEILYLPLMHSFTLVYSCTRSLSSDILCIYILFLG